jgi:ABC-type uncharacterized transport system substrate-binding protein
VFDAREYVEAGGLMSYGPDIDATYRQLATYVDKILNGTPPRWPLRLPGLLPRKRNSPRPRASAS